MTGHMAQVLAVALVIRPDEVDVVELGERAACGIAAELVDSALGSLTTGVSNDMFYFRTSKRPAGHPIGVYLYDE